MAPRPISSTELRDLTNTRIAIEEFCLRDSIAHGDIEWETELVAAYHRLQRLPEREPSDPTRLSDAWSAAHQRFHAALVAGCKSPWMLKIRGMLYVQTERYRRLSVPLRTTERDVAAEHKGIFDAVMAKDGDLTAELMRRHLTLTTEILVGSAELSETNIQ